MNMKSNFVHIKAYAALIAAPVLWGGALVAGRVVSAEIPPASAAFIRFAITSALLTLFVSLKKGAFPLPSRRSIPPLILAGASGVALFNLFLFAALSTVSAGRSAVIIAMTPAVVALVSVVRYGERQGALFPYALLLAFAGAALVISGGDIGSLLKKPLGLGELFMIGCVASWTVYSFAGRALLESISPTVAIMYTSAIGALILAIPAFIEGGIPVLFAAGPAVWGSLLYMSIGAAGIAHAFYYYGIREVGPSRSAIFMNLEPLSALLLGLFLLGESISLPLAAGALLVLAGVSLATRG
jgi:drug/metabolite transporter (DMT)-like permease